MTGVQTCALPICFPVTIRRAALERTIAIEEQLAQTTKKNAAEIYRAELVRIAQSQTASDLTIDQIQAFIEMSTDAAEELKNNDPSMFELIV